MKIRLIIWETPGETRWHAREDRPNASPGWAADSQTGVIRFAMKSVLDCLFEESKTNAHLLGELMKIEFEVYEQKKIEFKQVPK